MYAYHAAPWSDSYNERDRRTHHKRTKQHVQEEKTSWTWDEILDGKGSLTWEEILAGKDFVLSRVFVCLGFCMSRFMVA